MTRIEPEDAIMIGILDVQVYITNKDDPGSLGPYDLCADCCFDWNPQGDIEHPPYEDALPGEEYHCAWCNAQLTEDDDHPENSIPLFIPFPTQEIT